MQLSGTQTKAGIIVIIVAVICMGYFIWTRSASPEPTIPAGQTISNPLGETRKAFGVRQGQGTITVPGAEGTTNRIPKAGTVDPQLGMGPSKGAPIPQQ